VATDQKMSTIDTERVASGEVIENEIPTYRAISVRAIFSVVCGVLAVCSFAHWFFYGFSILAIGFGIWAHQKIKQLPDVLTGKGLANAGIFLGLVFGLTSATFFTVQYGVRSRQATLFAKQYAEVLKGADLSEMLWFNAHPDARRGKTGAELKAELDANPKDRRMMEASMGPMSQLLHLQERLSSTKGQDVHFIGIEALGDEATHTTAVNLFAYAVYQIDGPTSKRFPHEREHVLAVLKAKPRGRQYEWWVESVVYPYTPLTYKAPEAAVGDGHDHREGGH
jgi:hypothetical protein